MLIFLSILFVAAAIVVCCIAHYKYGVSTDEIMDIAMTSMLCISIIAASAWLILLVIVTFQVVLKN